MPDTIRWRILLVALSGWLSEILVSWRLLVGGLSPWLSHWSYSTTNEEPPLSNFNSYWDIAGLASRYDKQWQSCLRSVSIRARGFFPFGHNKQQQTVASSGTKRRSKIADSAGDDAGSGTVRHTAAKGGYRFLFRLLTGGLLVRIQPAEPKGARMNVLRPNVKLQGARAADNVGCVPRNHTQVARSVEPFKEACQVHADLEPEATRRRRRSSTRRCVTCAPQSVRPLPRRSIGAPSRGEWATLKYGHMVGDLALSKSARGLRRLECQST